MLLQGKGFTFVYPGGLLLGCHLFLLVQQVGVVCSAGLERSRSSEDSSLQYKSYLRGLLTLRYARCSCQGCGPAKLATRPCFERLQPQNSDFKSACRGLWRTAASLAGRSTAELRHCISSWGLPCDLPPVRLTFTDRDRLDDGPLQKLAGTSCSAKLSQTGSKVVTIGYRHD